MSLHDLRDTNDDTLFELRGGESMDRDGASRISDEIAHMSDVDVQDEIDATIDQHG